MRNALLILTIFFLLFSCGEIETQKLHVEEGKIYKSFKFEKLLEFNRQYEKPLIFSRGIFSCEVLDKSWKEVALKFYDFSGKLMIERKMNTGQGPNELQVFSSEESWESSSGKIFFIDHGYLKSINPENMIIETMTMLSNSIVGYGSRYSIGQHTFPTIEEKDNRVITTFESAGFFENRIYYIVSFEGLFQNFKVLAKAKLGPSTQLDAKKKEFPVDYYRALKDYRILTVDWKRSFIYYVPDIEKPEIERIDFTGARHKKYLIDIDFKKYRIERDEFELYYEYVLSETDPSLRDIMKNVLRIPPHPPALAGLKVIGDRLLIITGNRNWEKKENEVLVYDLPSLNYEGRCFIPYPNLFRIIWKDNYFMVKKLIKTEDDYFFPVEIYRMEEE